MSAAPSRLITGAPSLPTGIEGVLTSMPAIVPTPRCTTTSTLKPSRSRHRKDRGRELIALWSPADCKFRVRLIAGSRAG